MTSFSSRGQRDRETARVSQCLSIADQENTIELYVCWIVNDMSFHKTNLLYVYTRAADLDFIYVLAQATI